MAAGLLPGVASALVAAMLTVAGTGEAMAQTARTWDGGSNGTSNWTGGSGANSGDRNWVGDTAPANGSALVFAGTTRTTNTNNITNGSFASIAFNTGAGSFTIGGNALTLTGGAALTNNSSNLQAVNMNVALTAATGTVAATSANFTLGGVISGTNVTFTGLDTTLSGSNTYTGTTTIASGTVSAARIVVSAGASNLGNATSAVVLGSANSQGTLSYTGSSDTFTRGFAIGGNGGGRLDVTTANQTLTVGTGGVTGTGLFTLGGAGNLSITAAVTHAGGLSKQGAGLLTLSASNSYSGVSTLAAGTVRVTNAFGLGQSTAGNALTLSGGALQLAADTGTTFGPETGYDAVVTVNTTLTSDRLTAGPGVRHQLGLLAIGSQTLSVTAGSNVTSGTAALTFDGETTLTGSPTFDTATGTELRLNGGIAGAFTITKSGSGILTLGGPSGHANTTVSAGQLNINFLSGLGTSSGTLTMAANTRLGSTAPAAVTINNSKSIALGSNVTFVGPTSLNLGQGVTTLSATNTQISVTAGTLTFGGNVVGNGLGITKTGTGVLVLSGLTGGGYTGNTTISEGELFLDGSSVLSGGTGTIVTVGESGLLRIGASASTGGTTVRSRPGGVITSAVVNADVVFVQTGTLSADSANFNGTQTIDSAVEVVAAANYLGTVPATPVADRILLKNNATLRATAAFSINPNQGMRLESGTATLAASAGQALFVESEVSGSGALRKTGLGNVRLTGSNSYTGGTLVEQGIVGITSDASLGAIAGGVRIAGGELVAAQTTTGSATAVTLAVGRSLVIGSGTTSGLSAQTGNSLTIAGTIGETNALGEAANLRVGFTGAREGTVVLGAANTYRGSTLLQAGVLSLPTIGNGGQSSSLGSSSNLAANLLIGNATLRFTGANGSTDRLFTVQRSSSTAHNSTIEVASGTLAFTNGGAIGMGGTGVRSLTLGGAGVGSLAASLGNDAGGNATNLVKAGAGRWTLTGNNGFTGDTLVSAGTLILDGVNQTSSVVVADSAVLGGHGSLSEATLSGAGLVSPGNSPGILTAAQFDPTGGLDAAFEFTAFTPNYAVTGTGAMNDVLRLTDAAAFANSALTSANVIDVYLNRESVNYLDTFEGGFYAEQFTPEQLLTAVENATFVGWVRTAGAGERTFEGFNYNPISFTPGLTGLKVETKAGPGETGAVTTFMAVPEPSGLLLAGIGLLAIAGHCHRLHRRSRR